MNGHKRAGIHIRIALRGRKAGMTQKLLDGTQVAIFGQKMRRKAMAQRMGRGAFGQAKRPA